MSDGAVVVKRFTASATEQAALAELASLWTGSGQSFWSAQEVIASSRQADTLVAYLADPEREGSWLGFLMARKAADAAELYYVYLRPEARGQGLAAALLSHMLAAYAADPTVSAIYLEVRSTNTAAIKLYERLGFTRQRVRRKYYRDGEDAWIFKKDVSA